MKGGRIVTIVLLLCANLHGNEGATSCSGETFACPQTQGGSEVDCFPLDWLCDGDLDCQTNGTIHDETNCGPPPECRDSQFACSTTCISIDWVCDGEEDCFDGMDEDNCSLPPPQPPTCAQSEYECRGGNNHCILADWRCDGEEDCPQGDDEEGCDDDDCLGKFRCSTSGLCIDKSFECDGINECADFSDEHVGCNTTECADDEILCGAEGGPRICAKLTWICDEEVDCPKGWDESPLIHNCSFTNCTADEFRCSTGLCILQSYVCDGSNDCPEGEDEDPATGCGPRKLEECTGFYCNVSGICLLTRQRCNGVRECPDDSDEFNCTGHCDFRCSSDDMCLPQDKVCDGRTDCDDGSDESHLCGECSASNGGCDHVCVNQPTGPVCQCKEGYALQDGLCYDINECSIYGACSQSCHNTHGSYTCKCVAGYVKEDHLTMGHICKAAGPSGALYIAANRQIVRYSLDGLSEDVLIDGLNGVNDIAVDYQDEMIYWVEFFSKTLKKASLRNVSNVQVIVSEGIESPEGLTLDWVTKRLYWVDDLKNTVEVVGTDGSDHRVLKDALDKPRDIVVEPFQKTLYVSDWGDNPGIFSMKTDGSGFSILVNTTIAWPNGLALDYPSQRLYWVDAKYKIVESIKLDGTGREVISSLPDLSHPFAIDVFENLLMWSDWDRYEIHFNDRFTGEVVKSISVSDASLSGIKIAQAALQPSGPLCSRPSLPNYDLTNLRNLSYPTGTVVTLSCVKGYQLAGSEVVKCEDDGTWFPGLSNCIVQVTPTVTGALGSVNQLDSSSFGVGLVVGLAVCLLLAMALVVLLLALFWRKYRKTQKSATPTINFYSEKHSEASVALPDAEELDPNFSNGLISASV